MLQHKITGHACVVFQLQCTAPVPVASEVWSAWQNGAFTSYLVLLVTCASEVVALPARSGSVAWAPYLRMEGAPTARALRPCATCSERKRALVMRAASMNMHSLWLLHFLI